MITLADTFSGIAEQSDPAENNFASCGAHFQDEIRIIDRGALDNTLQGIHVKLADAPVPDGCSFV